jgi:hypothetical protein
MHKNKIKNRKNAINKVIDSWRLNIEKLYPIYNKRAGEEAKR